MRHSGGGWAAAGAILLWASIASAMTVKPGPGSLIRLDGTSTLHPYFAETKTFQADLTLQPASAADLKSAIEGNAPAALTVTIPVASLRSEHSGLDKNLRKALKADKNPDIVFALKSYEVLRGTATGIVAHGDLTIAGKTNPETLKAVLSSKDGHPLIKGQQPLLMSDFGVRPPTLMLGTLKTDDRIVVSFQLVLEPAGKDGKENGDERRH